ncbi:MAG: YabP/YqfC family sporulation protein [Clostridia bacterium]|nr:YabP/YqfC family sporulation protein [Clostridia bacterium]
MPKKVGFLTRFGAKLDIPREALPGSFGMTLSGQHELVVRGCKKILSYDKECIALALGKTALEIHGEKLFCTAFGARCVTVTGRIVSLTFEEAKK